MNFAACYAITPDEKFRTMADVSIRSLLEHNPGTPVFVKEHDGGDYPIGIKHHALQAFPDDLAVDWLLFLDADTRMTGPLDALEPKDGIEFCGRHETMWTRGRIQREAWTATCRAVGEPFVPVYNSGAFLIPASTAWAIGTAWKEWIYRLPRDAKDPLEAKEAARRKPWWVLEQCALSLAVARLRRQDWTRAEHSYHWESEHDRPGLIHHYSTKRWRNFLEDD